LERVRGGKTDGKAKQGKGRKEEKVEKRKSGKVVGKAEQAVESEKDEQSNWTKGTTGRACVPCRTSKVSCDRSTPCLVCNIFLLGVQHLNCSSEMCTAILKNLGRVDFALFYFAREPKVPAKGSTVSSEPPYCVSP
jgi:hypothetical protein